jgi:hyperosmotically inducible protein
MLRWWSAVFIFILSAALAATVAQSSLSMETGSATRSTTAPDLAGLAVAGQQSSGAMAQTSSAPMASNSMVQSGPSLAGTPQTGTASAPGAAPAGVAPTGTPTASATYGNQPAAGGGTYDQQIQKEVTDELRKHDWAREVRASSEDGIVTLQGTVPLYMDKERAYQKIHNKDHVQGVRNLIVVNGPRVSDDELRAKLADKLRYDRIDRGIMFNSYNLSVNSGVVTISGQARTPTDAESALAIVENTPGVRDVRDDIQVLPVSPMDDELRLRVARAIYSAPTLQKYSLDPQAPIRIVVDHGNVTLYGVVDSAADRQMAEMQARSVPGSFSVTDKLQVANQQVR